MAKTIDLDKLADMRERHAALQENYRSTAQRARDLSKSANRLVSEAALEADNEAGPALLSKTPNALAAVPDADLIAARLDPKAIARIIAARLTAAKVQATAEGLAVELKSSVELMARINDYAMRFEHTL